LFVTPSLGQSRRKTEQFKCLGLEAPRGGGVGTLVAKPLRILEVGFVSSDDSRACCSASTSAMMAVATSSSVISDTGFAARAESCDVFRGK
jgi:hypothetical protein